jgi:cytochrome P450
MLSATTSFASLVASAPRWKIMGMAAFLASVLISALTGLGVVNPKNWLWPNSAPDGDVDAPLPSGPGLGCPLFGQGLKVFVGSKQYGPGHFFYRMAQTFPLQHLYLYYAFGKTYVGLSGGATPIKQILSSEFEVDGVAIGLSPSNSSSILGTESLLMETKSKQKHTRLRRLVGQAMTPAAVAESIPTLQEIAEAQLQTIRNGANATSTVVSADQLCTDFTVDVAWKQILGLDLAPEEVPVFKERVDQWVLGIADPLNVALGVRLDFLPHWKAFEYLRGKINEKIDDLLQKGPDLSTLSGMVFAVDDEEEKDTAAASSGESPK